MLVRDALMRAKSVVAPWKYRLTISVRPVRWQQTSRRWITIFVILVPLVTRETIVKGYLNLSRSLGGVVVMFE